MWKSERLESYRQKLSKLHFVKPNSMRTLGAKLEERERTTTECQEELRPSTTKSRISADDITAQIAELRIV